MINIFKKYRVTFLNAEWEVMFDKVKVKELPRRDELVFIPEHDKYFKVINVVYNFVKGQKIFIIIEEHK